MELGYLVQTYFSISVNFHVKLDETEKNVKKIKIDVFIKYRASDQSDETEWRWSLWTENEVVTQSWLVFKSCWNISGFFKCDLKMGLQRINLNESYMRYI